MQFYDTGYTFSKVYFVVKEFDCKFAFLMTRYKDNNAPLVVACIMQIKRLFLDYSMKIMY